MSSDLQPFRDLLGQHATLRIRRFGDPGAFLVREGAPEDAPTLLLPRREVPEGAVEGDEVPVFVAMDSENRPIATAVAPKLTLGEVAFLRVTECSEFGAFADWGLPKELLVPFAEQTVKPREGESYPIALYVDNSGRLAGTMRVSECLATTSTGFSRGDWVEGEAWRVEPGLGLFVIVQRGLVALLPAHEPHSLVRGQAARFRVAHVHPDGKLELSLRAPAYEEMGSDAEKILALLQQPGAPRVGDKSDPDQLRALFGLSKKAFKRAVGRLLKERRVDVDAEGFVRVLPPG
jgi:predicted RNA-binding protein (virulence factor B family)